MAVDFWLVAEPYPSEKYESQLGLLCPIYGKIKNVPNHQPDFVPFIDAFPSCKPPFISGISPLEKC